MTEPWGPEQDATLRRLAESNARLEEAARMLDDVQREVAVIHAEASRLFEATMVQCEALIERLKTWPERGEDR